MNTAVITIKTESKLKNEVAKLADELGFSMSSLINAYLKHFVRTKTVNFTLNEEVPNEWMTKQLAESKKEIAKRKVSPTFTDAKSAVKWLKSD